MQDRLALLTIELTRLLPEEPVDVGIAAVDEGAASNDQGLDSGGRVTERAVAPLDEAAVRFLRSEERRVGKECRL